MHPNKAKPCPAAENVGTEARRVEMLRGYTRVSQSFDDGEVEALWECYTWVDSLLGNSDGGSEQ